MLDLANQSFNAVVPISSPLLPAAAITNAKPTFTPKPTFTSFRVLNSSPVHDVSTKLASGQDSPLTYSPGQGIPNDLEDHLWSDVKGFLETWNLDDEIAKRAQTTGEKDNSGMSQSQECLVEG